MKRYIWLMLLVLFLPVALSAQGHTSPNNCQEPPGSHFHWRVRGARPVAPPIENARDVARIANNESWYPIALKSWPINETDIQRMVLQAENGNFDRREIKPCTVLDDMIFGMPPVNYGGVVIYDPDDRQSAYAYV